MDYKIEVKDLNLTIKSNVILRNINLKIEAGKIYGFIGRNGSGKSMLLKSICGLLKPTTGNVIVDSEDIYKKDIFPSNTRAFIDKPSFIGNLTGFENLKLLADIQNKITDEEIKMALKKCDLEGQMNKKYGKYSLGMKQKLAIASVLMEDPDIMIFDEPFNGVDNKSVEKIRSILLTEKQKGKTILIATHIKEDIDLLCDVIYELDLGEIITS
ncbi:MAG TPA: ATP-binding cassette domain-containing protein [Mollicutes bacterium]|nr:ATP-binding cassette domain-containing protein [Mollicutes bacterium]